MADMDEVYEQFGSYDFQASPAYKNTLEQVYNQYLIVMSDKDLEVKQDLSNGVFNPSRIPQADREQLQLQTKIFVFCSETENILELQDYQFWLADKQRALGVPQGDAGASAGDDLDVDVDSQMVDSQHDVLAVEPTEEEYTSNYQEIVDMIVNNKPIPGIKQIPKTVLDPTSASESVLQQRRKPWETESETATSAVAAEAEVGAEATAPAPTDDKASQDEAMS